MQKKRQAGSPLPDFLYADYIGLSLLFVFHKGEEVLTSAVYSDTYYVLNKAAKSES